MEQDQYPPTGAGVHRGMTLPPELRPLVVLGTAALVVACLYWGQAVFIPFTLAGLIAFLLTPVVDTIERYGAGRVTSVLVVVLLAFCLTGGVGWILMRQIVALADELPQYSVNIRQRVADLRGFSKGGSVERMQRTLNEVVGEMQKADPGQPADKPVTVVVEPPAAILSHLPGLLGTLTTAGVVTVLVIFMLLERQDLRNRLIRFIGYRRVTVTTRALDEATVRISRYLLMQSIINGSFGVAAGVGLFLLGVPYASLWGFLAAALRFIPYVGPTMALALPAVLALAVFPGWTRPLMVIGLFVVLELVANMVLEPWLYGQSAGVSQVALLVAVVFWTWLWGPVGLLLATPLTVCLIVLSKHLPAMGFVVLLMGDEPVLDAKARYYQRLLARDQDEAADIVEEYLQINPRETVYDEVLLPAVSYAKGDWLRDQISEADAQFVVRATHEIIQELAQDRTSLANAEAREGTDHATDAHRLILLFPAKDEFDIVAVSMALQLIDPARWQVEMVGTALLTSEVAQIAEERRPAVVCIGSVAPGGLSHTRHLCKRVRARCPDLTLMVGRWGVYDEQLDDQRQLGEAGADRVALSLLELQRYADELSLLTERVPPSAESPQPVSAPVS